MLSMQGVLSVFGKEVDKYYEVDNILEVGTMLFILKKI